MTDMIIWIFVVLVLAILIYRGYCKREERRRWHYALYLRDNGTASYEDWLKVQRMWGFQ